MDERYWTPHAWEPPVLAVIGIGTGIGDIGTTAMAWIARAEVLVGGRRHLDLFPDHSGRKIALEASLIRQAEEIGRLAGERRTVVLASGDPLFFGIAARLARVLGKERLFVLPNVTSLQVLCARICRQWDNVAAASLHGRDEPAGLETIFQQLECGRTVAVFTDPVHSPKWIAGKIIEGGMEGCTLTVGENLGSPSERVRTYLPAEVEAAEFSTLNLVLIHPPCVDGKMRGRAAKGMVFGYPEEAFEREAGLITKMEVRAVALATLRLEPGLIMWDLGAGTGSVSIEAAQITPLKAVFAVERSDARYLKLRRNIKNFAVPRVKAVCGCAADAVRTLPDPDRVFIGGSGNDLDVILQTVAERLLPGGRVVQTIVMLDTLGKVMAFWKNRGFTVSVTQVQVSRSSPIGEDLRMEALNPVFIVSSWRAGEACH